MAAKRKKKKRVLKTVLIVLAVYFALVAAGAWFYDDRHAEIELNGEERVVLEYGETYSEPGAYAHTVGRLFRGEELELTAEGGEGIYDIGEYTVEYSCEYRNKRVTAQRTVVVSDTVAPEINLVPTLDFNAKKDTGYIEPGYYASDNHDGDITDRVHVEITDIKVIYTVSDSSGNPAPAVEREIVYAPQAPVIILDGSDNVTITACLRFEDPGFRAYDGDGNDITQMVSVGLRPEEKTGTKEAADIPPAGSDSSAPAEDALQPFTPYLPGTYELVYSLKMPQGVGVEAVRTVNVVPVDMPESKSPSKPTIYLTFDDGPGPYTEELLGILKKYNVKVTFFVTDQFPDYLDVISKEYAAGHTVAIHTYSHKYSEIYSGVEEYCADFNRMRDTIIELTGSETNLFRFPGGTSNTESRNYCKGIMTVLSQAMPAMGYKAFDWNVDSGDASTARNPDSVFNNVTSGIEYNINTFGYAVVLQHDIKEYSVHAVEDIILWGKQNGYTFAALDITSPRAWHNPAN